MSKISFLPSTKNRLRRNMFWRGIGSEIEQKSGTGGGLLRICFNGGKFDWGGEIFFGKGKKNWALSHPVSPPGGQPNLFQLGGLFRAPIGVGAPPRIPSIRPTDNCPRVFIRTRLAQPPGPADAAGFTDPLLFFRVEVGVGSGRVFLVSLAGGVRVLHDRANGFWCC